MEGLTLPWGSLGPRNLEGQIALPGRYGRGDGRTFETRAAMTQSHRTEKRREQPEKWSAEVTAHSDALDLEPNVFTKESPTKIAELLKRSAESSDRRKSSPYRRRCRSDPVRQPGRPEPIAKPKAHPRSSKGKTARAIPPQAVTMAVESPALLESFSREAISCRAFTLGKDATWTVFGEGPAGPSDSAKASPPLGQVFGVGGSIDMIIVPFRYVSGSSLSGTSTFDGATIASLGLTPGSYVYTWGSGVDADSMTVNIAGVPEPSTWAMMGLGFAALGVVASAPAGEPLSRPSETSRRKGLQRFI